MDYEEYEDDFLPVDGTKDPGDTEEKTDSESTKKINFFKKNTKNNQALDEVDYADDSQVETQANEVKKDKATKAFSIIIILSLIIIFLIAFFTNDFFKKYRNNFVMNVKVIDNRLGVSEKFCEWFGINDGDLLKKREENKAMGTTYDNETYLIPFENASEAKYCVSENEVIVAKSNYLACLNNKGENVWSMNTTVVNPIMEVEGKYIMLAENGGTKICLYAADELVFETDAQNQILNASVSSEGDVVVVTKKEFFKGAVEVYNFKGERVFSWSSGADSIVCADISPSGRRIAVGFLDSKSDITGSVQLFGIKDKESYKQIEIPNTVVFDLKFTGETLNVFGDNRLVGLSVQGDVLWDEKVDGEFCAYSVDNNGNKATVVDAHNLPVIKIYEKKGDLKQEIKTEGLPDYIYISNKLVLYNTNRMIVFGKNNKFEKYAATMDIKGLKILGKKTYLVIYNNSLEFVHL